MIDQLCVWVNMLVRFSGCCIWMVQQCSCSNCWTI